MQKKNKNDTIIYQKLVRDRIPEIIEKHGKKPFVREINGDVYRAALGRKALEEVFEFVEEWQGNNKEDVLKESADVLEVILAALAEYGFNLEDLLSKMQVRRKDRGGFEKRIFLDQVGGDAACDIESQHFSTFIFNPVQNGKFFSIIKNELKRSSKAWIASAFYSPGATNLLLHEFSDFIKSGGELKLLLSTMGNILKPEYLTHLQQFVPDIDLKVFHPKDIPFDKSPQNFHVKAWLFSHQDGQGSVITGSSNFTEAGMNKNIEWNHFSSGDVNLSAQDGISPFKTVVTEFERVWTEESVKVTDEFLEGYRKRYRKDDNWKVQPDFKSELFQKLQWGDQKSVVLPNNAQKQALENLADFRNRKIGKAAVVAATGVGKTFLAAFDFKNSKARRLLFIAHRETILLKTRDSFRLVMGDSLLGEILGNGSDVSPGCPVVFAMVQTLSRKRHIEKFPPEYFDYIVIDEFHHSEAASYRKILSYFKPEFLLGLTATPERMDGRDVLAACDYNVAYEVRLLEAVSRGWLAPFQYYAIYDETNYEKITWRGTRYDEQELNLALENDTRSAIIAHNLNKYLPSAGKIKALAFCSSISHARYTANKLSSEHSLEAVALWSDSTDDERRRAINRLQDELDSLKVICTVDLFNEGVDIPALSHVLFLRPTQSFTIFLQQLGRGLRKTAEKEFLVVLDFVGNFRKAHVAPLALCGYTSIQEFVAENRNSKIITLQDTLPEGCYLSPDLEVQRIWDSEIKSIIDPKLGPKDYLKMIYQDIKTDLGLERPLTLMDMLGNAYDVDPYHYLKPKFFGNWLRTQKFCENGKLRGTAEKLLDTPGEYLLEHIETGLKPVKSYKMVVLLVLLKLVDTRWQINDIAREFHAWYIQHPDHLTDYDALAKSEDPENFSLSNVAAHLKTMPLDKLSNMDTDCFILDRPGNFFSLKPEYATFWQDPYFKKLVEDRVRFALARYFKRERLQQTIYFNEKIFSEGFALDQRFAETFFENKPLGAGDSRKTQVMIEREKYSAHVSRSQNGRNYSLLYTSDSQIAEALQDRLGTESKKEDRVFKLVAEKNRLRIDIPEKKIDLRGIAADIPYAKKATSGMTAEFRRIISEAPENNRWEKIFDKAGYSGDMDIDIINGESFRAWTGSRYEDKSRFPARIKAVATALKEEGLRGEYHVAARGKGVSVRKID